MKTYDEDPSTKKLIEETLAFKILGKATELRLFEEYHKTKDHARKNAIKVAIIQSNLRFVLTVARAYKRSTGLPINDFYAEGKLGLLEAFNKFDYRQDIKFGSFAVYEIRRHMDLIVQHSDMVHVPVRIRKRVLAAKKNNESVDEINYGTLAANAVSETMSIDSPVQYDGKPDSGTTAVYADSLSSDSRTDEEYEEKFVKNSIFTLMEDNLTPEENNLLHRIYGLDGYEDTITEISSERGMSKDLIRQMKKRALEKLRKVPAMSELKAELG